MKSQRDLLVRFNAKARHINDEIAWSGADIREVLMALAGAGAVVLGAESVVMRGDAPMVEAISDITRAPNWRKVWPEAELARRSSEAVLADIQHAVGHPYADDMRYILVTEWD